MESILSSTGLKTEAGWRMYVSVKWVIIGSGHGLSPEWGQAITGNNDVNYFQ